MHTITVDDESLAVNAMLRVLKKKDPNGTHFGTVKVKEFLEYVKGRLSSREQYLALNDFKRNYYAWKKRHSQ